MGTHQSSRTARSLADDLRGRSPGQMRLLFTLRPDLLEPWPADLSAVARRAADDASVRQALTVLTTEQLRVLEVFAALHEAVIDEVNQALGSDHEGAVADLWDRALLWGGPTFKIVRAAQQAFGAYPCGLSAASHLLPEVEAVTQAALEIDPDRLRYLLWEHPVSTTGNALTVLRGEQHVVPREVSLILRHGLFLPSVQPPAPPPAVPPAPATGVWNVLAGVRYLLTDIDREGLAHSTQRGVSRRSLADRAATMAVPADDLAVWLELAAAAGLVGTVEGVVRATAEAFSWLAASPDLMWQTLMEGWLSSDRPLTACRPEGLGCLTSQTRARTAALRQEILAVWPPGVVTLAGLQEWLQYYRPRLVDAQETALDVVEELTALGLLVGGIPVAEAATPLAVRVPATDPVIIVQPDQTLIAPANIDNATWALVSAIAKVESWGPVIGMRIEPARLRTAVTRQPPAMLLQRLSEHSRTPLPQSLDYLIKDAARGAAAQIERVTLARVAPEDREALLALGWEEMAPATFVTPLPGDAARRALAEAGIATDGEPTRVVALPMDSARGGSPDLQAVDRLVAHLVAPPHDPGEAPQLSPADPGTLREQLAAPRVWLEFSEGDRTLTHLVEPLEIRSGSVSAWSLSASRTLTIPLSRIAAVRIAE